MRIKYGAAFDAQLQSIAKENNDGKAVGILTTIIDITERKKSEEKIEHLASFPQLNPNPVIETDLKGQVIFYNAATMRILKEVKRPGRCPPLSPARSDRNNKNAGTGKRWAIHIP